MQVNYEYYYTKQAVGNLSVEDIGNCCISANNDIGDFYFLLIKTEYGISTVLEYGPYNENVSNSFVSSLYQRFDYNEQRLNKIIEKFLNSAHRDITQALVVELEDIEDKLFNLLDLWKED